MLAYLFWHSPADIQSAAPYQERLRAFHHALRQNAPDGFLGSACFRVTGLAWLPESPCFEDWYLVRDFASLGALNEAAVNGPRKYPHDQVAAQAAWGAGGLYSLVRGPGNLSQTRYSAWFKKPVGVPYSTFFDAIGQEYSWDVVSLWQRQMVLGPAPEFCLLSNHPVTVRPELLPALSHLESVC